MEVRRDRFRWKLGYPNWEAKKKTKGEKGQRDRGSHPRVRLRMTLLMN